jgi:hypothetical protein
MMGSKVDPKSIKNPIAFVPQVGCLCGDLTARETTRDNAMLKHNLPREEIDKEVQGVLEKLGIAHVADGIIGTVLFVSYFLFTSLFKVECDDIFRNSVASAVARRRERKSQPS